MEVGPPVDAGHVASQLVLLPLEMEVGPPHFVSLEIIGVVLLPLEMEVGPPDSLNNQFSLAVLLPLEMEVGPPLLLQCPDKPLGVATSRNGGRSTWVFIITCSEMR